MPYLPHAPRRSATRSSFIEPLEPRQLLAVVAPGFSERLVAANVPNPTDMQFAPDGRLFVLQQTGQVRVIATNRLVAAPVLRIRVDSSSERGLLGIAFDPDFAANSFFYLYHTTATGPKINRVVRYTLSGNSVIPRSGKVIVSLDRLSSRTNHNGGAMHFGPDGKLYIAVGENAQPANAQSPANRLGKILRYNPDGSIPADNPFFNDPAFVGQNKAIWAMGLRNPYTFALQPGTGKMHINDVGQNSWEEINVGRAGGHRRAIQSRLVSRLHPADPCLCQRRRQLRDHWRRILQPGPPAVPGGLPRRLFLRRFVRRVDPPARAQRPACPRRLRQRHPPAR